jgi:hypothetical protein
MERMVKGGWGVATIGTDNIRGKLGHLIVWLDDHVKQQKHTIWFVMSII